MICFPLGNDFLTRRWFLRRYDEAENVIFPSNGSAAGRAAAQSGVRSSSGRPCHQQRIWLLATVDVSLDAAPASAEIHEHDP
jgi:hypothetical protein